MPRYLINSAILKSGKDPKTCAEGAIRMLAQKPIKGIALKSCYCCANENRVAFIIEGPSQEAVLETVQEHLNVPVASIMEAEEVK